MSDDALEPALTQALTHHRDERARLRLIAEFASDIMPASERAAFESHLESCAVCSQDLADLRTLDAADQPPSTVADEMSGKVLSFPPRHWLPLTIVVGALAAALLAWVLRHDTATTVATRPDPAPEVLAKGAWTLHVGVRRGDQALTLAPGDPLLPGDAIGLFYSAGQPGHVMVFYVSDDEPATRIVPAEHSASLAIEAGSRRPLPDSAVVETRRGCAAIVAVFAAHHFDATTANAAVNETLAELGGRAQCRSGTIHRGGFAITVHRAMPASP